MRRRRTCATRCAAGHRKRPATEDEDDVVAGQYGAGFALCGVPVEPAPAKTKGAPLLQRRRMGEPVLVYTGTTAGAGAVRGRTPTGEAEAAKIKKTEPSRRGQAGAEDGAASRRGQRRHRTPPKPQSPREATRSRAEDLAKPPPTQTAPTQATQARDRRPARRRRSTRLRDALQ